MKIVMQICAIVSLMGVLQASDVMPTVYDPFLLKPKVSPLDIAEEVSSRMKQLVSKELHYQAISAARELYVACLDVSSVMTQEDRIFWTLARRCCAEIVALHEDNYTKLSRSIMHSGACFFPSIPCSQEILTALNMIESHYHYGSIFVAVSEVKTLKKLRSKWINKVRELPARQVFLEL